MTARNRQTGDRRPDVIRARRQALAARRRVKAEQRKRAKRLPPLPHEVPPGFRGQVRPYRTIDPVTGVEINDSGMAP